MGKIFSRKNLYLYDHCYVGRYLKKKKKNFIHMSDWANWATGEKNKWKLMRTT